MALETRLQAFHLYTRLVSTSLPVILRTVEVNDASCHADILTADMRSEDPAVKGLTAERSQELIAAQRQSASTPTVLGDNRRVISGPNRLNMSLVLKAKSGDEVMIGLGGFGCIKDWERDGVTVRVGDVGVSVDEKYRGRGYAIEAMKLAIEWGFTPVAKGGPQLDIVTVTTTATNAKMIQLTENKLGLKGKGVKRPHTFGDPAGEIYYELTADEWKALSV